MSSSDHTYYNVGAPRAIGSPQKASADKLFTPINKAFEKYKTSEFTFVHGEAVGVDEKTKAVSIKGSGATGNTSLEYTVLVIATGKTANPLWRLTGDHSITIAAFEDIHKRLPTAKSVVVVGGGPTGVEVAAEIAAFYPGKDITLLSGTSRLLSRLENKGVSSQAEKKLAALKVKTVHNVRVRSVTKTQDGTKTALEFNDGSKDVVDVYLDATGGTPNTQFLPTGWLDASSNQVLTDGVTLRATNAPAGIYSIGDAASFSKSSVMDATWPVPALAYSIWYDIETGKVPSANGAGKRERSPANLSALKEKKYKQIQSDMQMVPTGPSGGVGVMFGWRIPSWLVWLMKSRTFGIENAAKWADGFQTP